MKPSSRRTVALLLRRLQSSPLPAASASLQPQCRLVTTSTTTTSDKKPLAPTSRKGTAIPFSTAIREEYDDEEPEMMQTSATLSKQNNNGAIRKNGFSSLSQAAKPKPTRCTCGYIDQKKVDEDTHDPLPPPLPKPKYSVHKRVLPVNLTALSAPLGRQYLQESMTHQMAESYWALTEQFVNQSDPAYCGVTTLLMVLNAMNVDPNSRWKGGWRYYGDEDVLLQRCCLNTERIRRVGITMEQFLILGTCHGMRITMKRPTVENASEQPPSSSPQFSLEDFRNDIRQTLDSRVNTENTMLVTSFSRAALQQTGDGHFSPIAAYHEESDQVLILDVARFKYAPYWVGVEELYQSMQPLDEFTHLPRGWYIMRPPSSQQYPHSYEMTTEDRRPAHLVPESHEQEACPVGKIKVQFCPAKANSSRAKEEEEGPKELR